jgi:transcriptional regulator with PAS, ATPase and Fis domain
MRDPDAANALSPMRPERARHHSLDDYATDDAPMRSCLELARAAARTDLPILILGETGTGKTLLARAIHNTSSRAPYAFVSFNAAALSETLLDSQLFGHERGAFTGADRRVKGKFELAHQGTLFIDEIADMSPGAQAKILRAVDYGEFERLGSETLQLAHVRLISATYLPLRRYVRSEHFRQDLFYRISGITINLPPIRDRPNDLRALIAAEITAAAREQHKTITALGRTAAERLFAHPWPGNLRELKRVIQTAVALSEGTTILPDALLLDIAVIDARHAPGSGTHAPDDGSPSQAGTPADEQSLRLADVERRHIEHVLRLTDGNKRRAARLLGVSRSTLDRKLGAHAAEPAQNAIHSSGPSSRESSTAF